MAAIEAEADKVRDRLGIVFDIIGAVEDVELPDACSIKVFRIFKEALTNIVRHAGATRVTVTLMQHEDRVTLTVSDNGRGITAEQLRGTSSLGLASMRERAWLVDGSLRIRGEPGQGTTVFLSIPRDDDRSWGSVENTDS